MGFNLQTLARKNILTLQPYRCARDDFTEGILLDANENTHGPSVAEGVTSNLEFNRYPDPHQVDFKQQFVDFRNSEAAIANAPVSNVGLAPLTPDNLCLGVGSDESIDALMRCFCHPGRDKLLICPPTYGMYDICATVNDIDIVRVPLFPDFSLNTEAIITAVTSDPSIKLIYLTTPGNPTGKLLDFERSIAPLLSLESWNGIVITDEAYVDFSPVGSSLSPLVTKYANLVVLQTLSKSFGLAGIRVGITFADEAVSRILNNIKYPYNISCLSADIAIKATTPQSIKLMREKVNTIIGQRDVLVNELLAIKGVGKNIGGLDANFVLLVIMSDESASAVPSNEVAQLLYTKLATENAVVVRFRGKEIFCEGALRVTVGTEAENRTLVEKFRKVLGEIYASK
ncbi:hypothetical protein BABINDRAFT_30784 [Babjeviella inositovora NRRL Y-12698]|uniref:histidinol-phosphate transaminase n=1 Tax=Babjeviella inositovora NRRL Y-12698 TaxID=984486 RepID=A0A1E3QZ38_9ASCO|nr:uncharacterized protein BABINDRAFT_30784 [Babjeviella inositovora NRRL Y-12698]ODQ82891.1 hypothetical protein BABINDRAFT_30784 [Babjeviella inositovora NRRL Y-12698]